MTRDPEIIDLVRKKLDIGGRSKKVLQLADVKKIFKINDPYLAGRAFKVIAGKNRKSVSKDVALAKLTQILFGTKETVLRFLFELHDQNEKGAVDRTDVKKMLDAGLRQNEIKLDPAEKKDLVDAIFTKAEKSQGEAIDFETFAKVLKSNSEVYEGVVSGVEKMFLGELADKVKKPRVKRRFFGTISFLITTVPAIVWRFALIAGYLALNLWLGFNAFETYRESGSSIWIQIARACGAILNLNGALILLPMMRGVIGWLRQSPLSRLIPVDEHIEIHKLFGNVLFFVGIVHTGAHFANYMTLSLPFEDSLFKTLAGLTGVIVLGILLLMWFFARNFVRRSKRFELFYLSHMLYFLWFIAMLIHAPHFYLWAGVPLIAYFVEWAIQLKQARHVSLVTVANIFPGKVTEICIKRPPNFDYQPGDYAYIKVPSISRFEWHPFTLSSNPEKLEELSFHVRSSGNWTNALYSFFQKHPKSPTPVFLAGPYGTPSNRIFKTKHVILVGAGIGVTPFASILKSLLDQKLAKNKTKVESVKFIWLNRGQTSFEWFGNLLSDLETMGPKGFFDIRIYMTNASVGPASSLLRLSMNIVHKRTKHDLTTGLKSKTYFGRPDWDSLFEDFREKRGPGFSSVFFCGPGQLSSEVRAASMYYGFKFRKENF